MKYFFILICSFVLSFLHAQNTFKSGMPDSSFGINGKTLFTYNEGGIESFDAAMQNGNKIICVGDGSRRFSGTDRGFAVFRFLETGLIDTSFGKDGSTFINAGYNGQKANAVTIQNDNKILITGYGVNGTINLNYDIVIIRLNSNGSIDSSFGDNGIKIADYGSGDIAHDIITQQDGKILIQGSSSGYFITVRYLQNGTIDETFGVNGKVTTKFDGLATGFSISMQEDGKIVAAGTDDEKILLARYFSDGKPDISFGINGEVRSDLTRNYDRAYNVLVQQDGKIVVTGNKSNIVTDSVLLARYNSDGSLDASFGNQGVIIPRLPYNSIATKTVLQSDGKLITGGYKYERENPGQDFLLLRFNLNGTIDSGFAYDGHQVTNLSITDAAYGLLLTNDDKIVLAGSSTDGIYNYVSLARYHNNEVTTAPTPIARIKCWLRKHGITWEDCPPSICNNITGYAVQRSPNGMNWSTVFRSPLTAHRSLLTNSYADPSPLPGTNYYRLQTTSVDGAVTYSNVIAISNELSVMSISPNPARNILRIEGLPSNQKIKITVANLNGNVAISLQLEANSSSSHNLNIAALKPGNYLLRVETEGEVATRQFVKE